MRIGFVDASVGAFTGGTESIIVNMGRVLARSHTVTVLTGASASTPTLSAIRQEPFTLVTLPFLPRTDPRNERLRARFRLSLQYDVEAISLFLSFLGSLRARRALAACDVLSFHYPTTSVLFSSFARIRAIPSIFHCPGHIWGPRFFTFNHTDVYLANSAVTEAHVWQKTGRHADGIVTPGVPRAATRGSPPVRRTEAPVLLGVGRQTRAKGAFRLLRIFHAVHARLPKSRLLVVGRNYEGDALPGEAARLGIHDAVEFAGEVPYQELPAYYARADVLVHPTRHESFGMVALEALRHGVPAVVSDLPVLREATSGCAEFLPIDEAEDWSDPLTQVWAERLVALIRDPDRRERLARDGLCQATQHQWDAKGSEFERFLLEARRRHAATRQETHERS